MNLRWSWDAQTRDVFKWVDPDAWDASVHDPVGVLGVVPRERLDALVDDPGFMRFLGEVRDEHQRYLDGDRWFQARKDTPLRSVAYFSPEFGIAEALPQYSGGLGVLAGDHLKACSDLGVPLVGIGLFYRHGYFRQSLSADGWQQERYPDLDPHAMALTPCDGITVEVDLAGAPLVARVWEADVGRVPLYLLDADVEENAPRPARHHRPALRRRDRAPAAPGDPPRHRRRARARRARHRRPGVPHQRGPRRVPRARAHPPAREGPGPLLPRGHRGGARGVHLHHPHAGARRHRPLPPRADRALLRRVGRRGGHQPRRAHAARAPPGRRARRALQHGGDGPAPGRPLQRGRQAARRGEPRDVQRPLARRAHRGGPDHLHHQRRARRHLGGAGDGRPPHPARAPRVARGRRRALGAASPDAHDDELWRAREQGREALVSFVRQRLRDQLMARGLSSSDVEWTDSVLDPRALTIGFARRFATYKRATLLLSQPDRLKRLLLSGDRPVQLVFAGKSHPADDTGKELIRQVSAFAADPEVRHRFVFVDDYDIAVARALLQGADVWLNNPRRPQEACGTSGMKAALNGGLNLSILDGWWDECFDGENGWAISSAEHLDDLERRDEVEAGSLFELLERQVVPLFYERWQGPVPRRWVQRVKHSLVTLGPFVTAARMVRDYTEQLYEPTAAQGDVLRADGYAAARELSGVEGRGRRGLAGRARRPRGARRLARRARHRADGGGDRRAGRPRTRRRRGAAPPRPGRSGPGAQRPRGGGARGGGGGRRRPPALPRPLHLPAGRPLRHHGADRAHPPHAREPGGAGQGRLGR